MHRKPLMVADALLGVSYLLVLACTILILSGCSTTGGTVTCSISSESFNCGIERSSSQDLRANLSVAKDEKPDKPFTGPLQRFEEAPS